MFLFAFTFSSSFLLFLFFSPDNFFDDCYHHGQRGLGVEEGGELAVLNRLPENVNRVVGRACVPQEMNTTTNK